MMLRIAKEDDDVDRDRLRVCDRQVQSCARTSRRSSWDVRSRSSYFNDHPISIVQGSRVYESYMAFLAGTTVVKKKAKQ
jgi:hypothetical protein